MDQDLPTIGQSAGTSRQVKEAFDAAGVSIPFPQQDPHIKDLATISGWKADPTPAGRSRLRWATPDGDLQRQSATRPGVGHGPGRRLSRQTAASASMPPI